MSLSVKGEKEAAVGVETEKEARRRFDIVVLRQETGRFWLWLCNGATTGLYGPARLMQQQLLLLQLLQTVEQAPGCCPGLSRPLSQSRGGRWVLRGRFSPQAISGRAPGVRRGCR